MIRGHLDSVTSSGFVEGWALDDEAALEPIDVVVESDEGEALAAGRADRFRADLADAELGAGWCAFRLRSDVAVSRLRHMGLRLRHAGDGAELHRMEDAPLFDDAEALLNSVESVLAHDPTVLRNLDALAGCGPVFARFVEARGVDDFVRVAYVYILGRPADPGGFALYGKLLRDAELSPYALLRVLSESEEYRSRDRLLSAPTMPGFPFRC